MIKLWRFIGEMYVCKVYVSKEAVKYLARFNRFQYSSAKLCSSPGGAARIPFPFPFQPSLRALVILSFLFLSFLLGKKKMIGISIRSTLHHILRPIIIISLLSSIKRPFISLMCMFFLLSFHCPRSRSLKLRHNSKESWAEWK
jgi:hypothetical protein